MTNENDINIRGRFILAVSVVAFAVILIVFSFFAEPIGILHPSILTALGELLAFAGSILGIDTSYQKKKMEYLKEQKNVTY